LVATVSSRAKDGDAVAHVGSDERVADIAPGAEFDQFGVEADQPSLVAQRSGGGDVVDQAGLTAAGFSGNEQVAVDDVEVDVLAELVDADEERVEHRQAGPDRHPVGAQWVTGDGRHWWCLLEAMGGRRHPRMGGRPTPDRRA
jgi:hypothetical protein